MKFKKRIIAAGFIVVFLAATLYVGRKGTIANEEIQRALLAPKETIRIWYADAALTDYINSAAISFSEEHNIRVIPELQTGLEYLEGVNKASLAEEGVPDLYITSNDTLGKAYLAGLAVPIKDTEGIATTDYYPAPAIEAVTYQDELVGYPFYYQTSVLLYNKTYMSDIAKTAIEEEVDAKVAEEAQAAADQAVADGDAETVLNTEAATEIAAEVIADDVIQEKEVAIIPKTIDDILTFADEYDAPEAVEAVFKWDVSDIFYNYWIVGNYMIVGGEAGDKPDNIDIYNQNTIDCLRVYQNLNQFFSIDTKEVTYDSVLQDFMDGKIVFSVVTTDAIAKIEEAKAAGTFNYDYGIAAIPDLNANLKTKSLSVTNAVVINGYSEKKETANAFAKYLVDDTVDTLYAKSGKVASKLNVPYENPNVAAVMEEYQKSVSMPKMIETSNFWVQLEICFTKIWTGEDVNQQLKQLSEQIMTQVTGTMYEEEQIVEPVKEVVPTEEFVDTGE